MIQYEIHAEFLFSQTLHPHYSQKEHCTQEGFTVLVLNQVLGQVQ